MSYSPEDRDAIRAVLRRAAIVSVDDSGTQQLLSVSGLASDLLKKIVHVQPHGLSSVPPVGGEGLLGCPGGRSDRAMFLGGEHKDHRPKGTESGGTVLYDANGQAVSLVKHNLRVVGTDTITITAPTIVLNGTVYLGAQPGATPIKLNSGAPATKVNAV